MAKITDPTLLAKIGQSTQPTGGTVMDPIMQGLTMGWSDELGAKGAELGSRIYDIVNDRTRSEDEYGRINANELARQRQDLAAYRERNPVTSFANEMAGGIVAGGPGAASSSLPRTVAAMGLEGATIGAGTADTNKLQGGAEGAAWGLGTGFAIPKAAELVAMGYNKARGYLTNLLGKNNQRAVEKILQDAFEGVTPDQIRANALENPNAVNAELGGQKPIGLTQAASAASEEVRNTAQMVANNRRAAQTQRMNNTIRDNIGDMPEADEAFEGIREWQKQNAGPLYDEAFAVKLPVDDELVEILNRPAIKKILPEVIELAANKGQRLPEIEKFLAGDSAIPSMRSLDYVKKVLDKRIGSLLKSTDSAAKTQVDSLMAVRDAMKKRMIELNPKYGDALSTYSGGAKIRTELEEGMNIFNTKMVDFRPMIKNMNASERQAYLIGTVEALKEKMGRAATGSAREFNFLEGNNVKEKLKLLIPDTRAYNRFIKDIQNERNMLANEQFWVGNSQTAARQQGAEALQGSGAIPATLEALKNPTQIPGAVLDWAAKKMGKYSDETIQEIGSLLLERNPEKLIKVLTSKGIPEAEVRAFVNQIMPEVNTQATTATLFPGTFGAMQNDE
jgi:hypothetical protein